MLLFRVTYIDDIYYFQRYTRYLNKLLGILLLTVPILSLQLIL